MGDGGARGPLWGAEVGALQLFRGEIREGLDGGERWVMTEQMR